VTAVGEMSRYETEGVVEQEPTTAVTYPLAHFVTGVRAGFQGKRPRVAETRSGVERRLAAVSRG
jgi:hypothetical protein